MGKCNANAAVNWPNQVQLLLVLSGVALLLPQMSQQAAPGELTNANFYTAGVVEFRQAVGENDLHNLADNLAGYMEIIKLANDTLADIIVFPEATLNHLSTVSFVPSVEQQLSPCLADPDYKYYAEFLVTISCAARNISKYIVINISEQQLCSDTPEDPRPCAANGYNIFNSNVVFDRNGVVVSRYRKVHLYGEPRNSTYLPEIISFETDFNVTFGHFVCFDIMFYTPAHALIVEQGIQDFIYPTMWFAQLPFLTAVQVQQAWAYSNNVNLLAAGASRPEFGSTGTGIYHGREGTIISVTNVGDGDRSLYVGQVPKYQRLEAKRHRRSIKESTNRAQNSAGFIKMKRDYLEQYKSELLVLPANQAGGNVKQHVCHGQICCHFELDWLQLQLRATDNGNRNYSYRLGAYEGWRNEPVWDGNYIRNCGIFSCTGPSLEDCGQLFDTDAETQMLHHVSFTRLLIEATYPKSKEFLLMPNSLLDNLLPLEPAQFEWSVQELKDKPNQQQVRFALNDSLQLDNLLTFAIYGNYYDNVCTFNPETPEHNRLCGFVPTGDGAADLRFFGGSWVQFPLAMLLTLQLTR